MGKKHLIENTITICLSLLFLLNGCAMANKLYPLPETAVKIIGDKIYHNDKLFAELRYLRSDKKNNTHRGLAIYYYHPYNKEIWIFPEQGWRIFKGDKKYYSIKEIEEAWHKRGIRGLLLGNKRADKSEAVFRWCFDVSLSNDGKDVYFKTPGLFFDSLHKYLVESGTSKVIEKKFHQRLW